MQRTLLTAAILLFAGLISAQKFINAGFEKFDPTTGAPDIWAMGIGNGSKTGAATLTVDSTTGAEGQYSGRFEVKGGSFGAFSLTIPADFAGKTISLKGYIKTENVSPDGKGWAGWWMRLDSDLGSAGFDNMQGRGPNGTTGWQEYSIELDYPEETRTVVIGGLIVGKGTAWYDKLEILVDGKPLSQAPPRVIKKTPAELDSAFVDGSRINLGKLDKRRIEDLTLLGQVWGFLKYHHPKVASGDLNWDFELFRFLQQYPAGLSENDRDARLVSWIESLGPLAECPSCTKKVSGTIQLEADKWWLKKGYLSKGLKNKLEEVYNRRNQSKHYYIDHAENIGNPVFLHENAYKQFKYPDEGYRLLAVYRYWNMIEYFFPYRDIIGVDWSDVLREFIPKAVAAPDALNYKLCMRDLIARIHDTHANLWSQDPELTRYLGELRPAVQVKFIENEAVVTGYYHPELGKATGLQPGDVITAIDGKSVKSIVAERLPHYPASNEPTKLRDIAKNLLRTNNPALTLSVVRGTEKLDKKVDCYNAQEMGYTMAIDWAHNMPDSCYRLLTPDIGYLYLGNVKNDLLESAMEKFKNTKGLIVDIRNYPSEFVVFTLTHFLKYEPSEFVYFSAGNVRHPGTFTKTEKMVCGNENEEPYAGKVVILVNEMSQSQAEYTSMALRSVPGAQIVGSTTAGADGNVSEIMLPGGLRTMISGIGVFYPDGKPTQRVGIVPDHTVLPTIRGIREGRDELLEFAMKLILGP